MVDSVFNVFLPLDDDNDTVVDVVAKFAGEKPKLQELVEKYKEDDKKVIEN